MWVCKVVSYQRSPPTFIKKWSGLEQNKTLIFSKTSTSGDPDRWGCSECCDRNTLLSSSLLMEKCHGTAMGGREMIKCIKMRIVHIKYHHHEICTWWKQLLLSNEKDKNPLVVRAERGGKTSGWGFDWIINSITGLYYWKQGCNYEQHWKLVFSVIVHDIIKGK